MLTIFSKWQPCLDQCWYTGQMIPFLGLTLQQCIQVLDETYPQKSRLRAFLRHRVRNGYAWEKEFLYLGGFFQCSLIWFSCISRADVSICPTYSYLSNIHFVGLWLLLLSNWDLNSSLFLENKDVGYPYGKDPFDHLQNKRADFCDFFYFQLPESMNFYTLWQ